MTFLIWTLTLDFGLTMKKDEGVKLFRGFADRQTDRQTDICDCRVAFATEKSTNSLSLTNLVEKIQSKQIKLQ